MEFGMEFGIEFDALHRHARSASRPQRRQRTSHGQASSGCTAGLPAARWQCSTGEACLCRRRRVAAWQPLQARLAWVPAFGAPCPCRT